MGFEIVEPAAGNWEFCNTREEHENKRGDHYNVCNESNLVRPSGLRKMLRLCHLLGHCSVDAPVVPSGVVFVVSAVATVGYPWEGVQPIRKKLSIRNNAYRIRCIMDPFPFWLFRCGSKADHMGGESCYRG